MIASAVMIMYGTAARLTRAKPSASSGVNSRMITVMKAHATRRRVRPPPNFLPLIFRWLRDNHCVTLKIDIDTESAVEPFEQVHTQISELAGSGVLPVGYKLPTVRGLAETLGLAPNTVAKAYRTLETDGVIETRGRNGTFVA